MARRIRKIRRASEHDQQCMVHQWLVAKRIDHFSVPNGAHITGRNKWAQITKLLAEGLRAGAPDLVLCPMAPTTGRPVVVEMKREHDSDASTAQLVMHSILDRNGWHVILAKGHMQAIQALQALGY